MSNLIKKRPFGRFIVFIFLLRRGEDFRNRGDSGQGL